VGGQDNQYCDRSQQGEFSERIIVGAHSQWIKLIQGENYNEST
jgi:hypothetical protein